MKKEKKKEYCHLSQPKCNKDLLIQEFFTLEIPLFLRQIKVSNKRNPIYYSNRPGRGRRTTIPKKYANNYFNTEGYLIDNIGDRIIANFISVGTPKYQAINNQFIYAGNNITRRIIVSGLKDFLKPFVEKIDIIHKVPLIIECEIFTPPGLANWDIENISTIYSKVLNDLLVSEGKIKDDSIRYITKPAAGALYVPIESDNERKLVYKFYKDDRFEIQQLKLWERE